jgi:DNA-binding NarL/FixJ family response regulator
MKTAKIKLALVDDEHIVLDGLMSLLKKDERLKIAFATSDPAEMLRAMADADVDILLTDVMLPAIGGNLPATRLKQTYPSLRILAVSMNGHSNSVNEMIATGDVSGYVLKTTGRQQLRKALEKIAYGSEGLSANVQQASLSTNEDPHVQLTSREIEIVRLIEQEFNNKKIAEVLFISEKTVETHRKNIFRKTNTRSVIGLVKYAYQHNLI